MWNRQWRVKTQISSVSLRSWRMSVWQQIEARDGRGAFIVFTPCLVEDGGGTGVRLLTQSLMKLK